MNFNVAALGLVLVTKDSSTSPSVVDRSPHVPHLTVDADVNIVETSCAATVGI
jgi:hypothetical protein